MPDAIPPPPEAAHELVEEVGEDGTVLRVVTRAEMRSGRLRHRCVGIVVRRPGDGAVLVHRRAPWKDVWPSYWDVAFGGVVGPGEPWEDAAHRELSEEAGVDGDLTHLGRGTYEDDDVALVGEVYSVEHDGPFTFPDGEVSEAAWVPLDELRAWAASRPVCPDSLHLASKLWLP